MGIILVLSLTLFLHLGIIKEGGIRVNIIPEKAVLQLAVRAPTDKDVKLLKEKVVACFHAAATATGCQVSQFSKTCVKRPLKNRYKKIFMTNGSLMKVECIAECSHWSILQYFDLH